MNGKPHPTGRAGCIPVFDGSEWRVFKNSLTIYFGAENAADPAKVDVLRSNVNDLLDHYPETIPKLEKLGAKVKALLKHRIETHEDVSAWADSMFNSGPVDAKQPAHVHDTVHLAYDDVVIEVKTGKDPVYVIPAGPRGSGEGATLDFSVPGSKKRFGPRHEFSQAAFNEQIEKRTKPRPAAEGQRPRGRPRIDGLVPGSAEAKRADRKKEKEREAKRAARAARQAKRTPVANITELRTNRRRLTRVGGRKEEATS